MSAPFALARLQSSHNRTAFKSGSDSLDHYFAQQVTQDVRRRVTACSVALTAEQRIAGFYTLASAGLLLSDLPADVDARATLDLVDTAGAGSGLAR